MFPRRYLNVSPEHYEDLMLPLWCNPTPAHVRDLFAVAYVDQADLITELERLSAEAEDEAARTEAANLLTLARERQHSRGRLGLALVASYDGAKADAYGMTFDFSTPDAAVDTVLSEELPDDLRYWLINAPVQIPNVAVEQMGKSWASSWERGISNASRA